MNIIEILTRAKELAASDIHLTVGCPPVFRLFGVLKPQKEWAILTPEITEALCLQLMNNHAASLVKNKGQADFSFEVSKVGRSGEYLQAKGPFTAPSEQLILLFGLWKN